jgi:serine phosphatase RsbU (regulator of sigma subunit)
MDGVNRFLLHRAGRGKFITLVACVIDRRAATIEVVDAGHGFACLVTPGEPPVVIDAARGIPLGVDLAARHESTTFGLSARSRFVIFSDGAVEQTNDEGRQFGIDAALELIGRSADPDTDVASLLEAVRDHAGGPLSDDLTVASVIFEPDA